MSLAVAVRQARLLVEPAPLLPVALAVVGHGAGSGPDSPLVLAVATALAAHGLLTARLEQPYRVAGRRVPDPAPRLDAVLTAAVHRLRRDAGAGPGADGADGSTAEDTGPGLPLLLAGASSGGRVACRVAPVLAAAGVPVLGVAALGFPLQPPGRRGGTPRPSRLHELAGAAAAVPVLVVQGERDSFGGPGDLPRTVTVHAVAGADHSFAVRHRDGRDQAGVLAEVAAAVTAWALACRQLVAPSQ